MVIFLRSLVSPTQLILLSHLLRITTSTSAFITGFLLYPNYGDLTSLFFFFWRGFRPVLRICIASSLPNNLSYCPPAGLLPTPGKQRSLLPSFLRHHPHTSSDTAHSQPTSHTDTIATSESPKQVPLRQRADHPRRLWEKQYKTEQSVQEKFVFWCSCPHMVKCPPQKKNLLLLTHD